MSNSYTDKIAKELNKKLCCIKSDLGGQEPVTITYDTETSEFTLTDQFGNDTIVNISLGTFFYTVNTYNDLPDPVLVSGGVYWVSNSQGTYWLPGSLGGTYYPKGIYYSNGVSWGYAESPYEATLLEVNLGVNNNKFVTPYTFQNSDTIVNLNNNVGDLQTEQEDLMALIIAL